jgi:hypothetical protein
MKKKNKKREECMKNEVALSGMKRKLDLEAFWMVWLLFYPFAMEVSSNKEKTFSLCNL